MYNLEVVNRRANVRLEFSLQGLQGDSPINAHVQCWKATSRYVCMRLNRQQVTGCHSDVYSSIDFSISDNNDIEMIKVTVESLNVTVSSGRT